MGELTHEPKGEWENGSKENERPPPLEDETPSQGNNSRSPKIVEEEEEEGEEPERGIGGACSVRSKRPGLASEDSGTQSQGAGYHQHGAIAPSW